MTDPGHRDHVGSVAEEAAKLLDALQGWAQDAGHAHDAGSGVGGRGTADCAWCPVCRGVSLLRQTSPSVRGHLAVAAGALLQAAAELLETSAPPPGARAPDVERIDLDPDGDAAPGRPADAAPDGWEAE